MKLLAHLPIACGSYGIAGLVAETCLFPLEAQETEQRFKLGSRVGDEGVVIDVVNVVAELLLPVRHQSPVLSVIMPNILQPQAVRHPIPEIEEEGGKDVVEGVADRVNDLGL